MSQRQPFTPTNIDDAFVAGWYQGRGMTGPKFMAPERTTPVQIAHEFERGISEGWAFQEEFDRMSEITQTTEPMPNVRPRIYIASQILGTVHIATELPSGFKLEQFHDEGPSVNNRRPPRCLATADLRLLAEHYYYSAGDLDFLAQAAFGTWQKVLFDGGLGWEQQNR